MAKVMVVDDSMADLKYAESVLTAASHRVMLCPGGEGIEQQVVSGKADVILLDIVMPGRNGYEILRSLRRTEEAKHIPVVVISSKGQPTDIEWGKRQGAADYLVKPYSADALKAAVDKVVARG